MIYRDLDLEEMRRFSSEAKYWRVYHCWSACGSLLYIGQTRDWAHRRSAHRSRTTWWSEVADVTISIPLNRADAFELEVRCIRRAHPLYNILHKRVA